MNVSCHFKQAPLNPQKPDGEQQPEREVQPKKIDSKDKSIDKDSAQQPSADSHRIEPKPDVSEQLQNTHPISSEEHHDGTPRLEPAERSDSQQQLSRPDHELQECKIQLLQNALSRAISLLIIM